MTAGPSSLDRLVAERERARALYRRPAGIGAVLLIILLGVICAIWGINNPRTLPDVQGQINVQRTLSVAQPRDIGLLSVNQDQEEEQEQATIHLDAVAAHVVENSANADIAFSVCTMEYPRPTRGLMPPLSDLCTSIVPVKGVDLTIGPGAVQQLVMTVTAHRAGNVSVEGVDVSYSDSWRHGTQRTGPSVNLHFG